MGGALRDRLDEIAAGLTVVSRNPTRAAAKATLTRLIDALPVAALVADDHGHYLIANRAACELTGYRNAELRRLSVWDMTPGANQHDAEVLWRAFLQQRKQSGDYQLVTKAGHVLKADYAARADVLPGFHLSLLEPKSP